MKGVREIARGAGLFALLLAPANVSAHAFGQQYTLPIPLSFYIVGAGAALVASFVILGFFSQPGGHTHTYQKNITLPEGISRLFSGGLRTFGVLVLLFTIGTAFFGSSEPYENPSVFLFWVGLLLTITYASAIVSGVWKRLDPFRFLARLALGKDYKSIFEFPRWLRYIPALLFYFGLLWFELLSFGAGALPQNVGLFLIGYGVLTIFGIGLFGAGAWFRYGDFFSVFFGVVERFAPLRVEERTLVVTLPGEKLFETSPRSFGLLVFILLMLSSTAFDALRETRLWFDTVSASAFVLRNYEMVSTLALIVSPFVFLALYAAAIYFMCLITQSRSRFFAMLLGFTFSLVPIVVAYNFAHYFTLILVEGQNLLPVLSDPFARGWDIIGTADYVFNPGIISASTVWYTQVAVILIGHIVATYVAHRIALREYHTRAHVILGQIPMLALMVFYTGFGLWILSLPFSL